MGGVSWPFTTESKVLSALEREHKLEFELEFEVWGAGMGFGGDEGVFCSLILDERRRPELEFFWSSPISLAVVSIKDMTTAFANSGVISLASA